MKRRKKTPVKLTGLAPVELVRDTLELLFDLAYVVEGFTLSDTVALVVLMRHVKKRASELAEVRMAYKSLSEDNRQYIRLYFLERLGARHEETEHRVEAAFAILDNFKILTAM